MATITVEILEEAFRQPSAEHEDYKIDSSRDFTWLRVPDEVRLGLLNLLGGLSEMQLQERGLSVEEARAMSVLYNALT